MAGLDKREANLRKAHDDADAARAEAQKALDKLSKNSEGDLKTGIDIIRRCVEEPMRMIAVNAGHDGAIIVDIAQGAVFRGSVAHSP